MIFVQGTAGVTFSPGGFGYFNPGGSYNVSLSYFYIGKYEVTQAEYESVMGTNPSHFGGDPERPVEQVSWFNAIEFCNRLSMMEGLTPVYSYGNHGTDPDYWPGSWSTSDDHHVYVNADWSADGFVYPPRWSVSLPRVVVYQLRLPEHLKMNG